MEQQFLLHFQYDQRSTTRRNSVRVCFYVNDLFSKPRKNKTGFWVHGTFLGIIGFSDDSLLLAPSFHALREKLKTYEEYADFLNLYFSTDKNSEKCKTKYLAFFRKNPHPLIPLTFCGKPPPLGMTIASSVDGMKTNLKIKRADYISKNIEILQGFLFSYPRTQIMINLIYNSHLTGSCLWDFFPMKLYKWRILGMCPCDSCLFMLFLSNSFCAVRCLRLFQDIQEKPLLNH